MMAVAGLDLMICLIGMNRGRTMGGGVGGNVVDSVSLYLRWLF